MGGTVREVIFECVFFSETTKTVVAYVGLTIVFGFPATRRDRFWTKV